VKYIYKIKINKNDDEEQYKTSLFGKICKKSTVQIKDFCVCHTYENNMYDDFDYC